MKRFYISYYNCKNTYIVDIILRLMAQLLAKKGMSQRQFWAVNCIFSFFVFSIFAVALLKRLWLPSTVLLDGDTAAYLNPALEFLGGKGLAPSQSRGVYYPLFLVFSISIGRSINSIATIQHFLAMAGLVLIAFSFNKMLQRNLISKYLVVLPCLIWIGWNNEMMLLEHSIRPEGLAIFFAGALFLLLQNLLTRKTFLPYLVLIIVSLLMFLTQFKFALGGLFIMAYATFFYLRTSPLSAIRLKQVFIVLGTSSITLFATNNLFKPYDSYSPSFAAKTFFFINCRLISHSAAFDLKFNPEEKKALFNATTKSRYDSHWPLLGFNADELMYGPLSAIIESHFGNNIYQKIMMKSAIYCLPELTAKVLKQMRVYYFGVNKSERIPNPNNFGYSYCIQGASWFTKDINNPVPKLKEDYEHAMNINLAQLNISGDAYIKIKTILWMGGMLICMPLFVFALFYSCHNICQWRYDLLTLLFITHLLVLLTISTLHTLDNTRYSDALFPLYALVITLSWLKLLDIFQSIRFSKRLDFTAR